jgi:hypothetical protein
LKTPNIMSCSQGGHSFQNGEFSYIKTVKWDDFTGNVSTYLDAAVKLRDERDRYNIAVNVN